MATRIEREFKELLEEEMKEAFVFDAESLQRFKDWMERNLEPEEIFTEDQLQAWAEKNGYTKE